MATKLTKSVRREVTLTGTSGRSDAFIVTLHENTCISFRRKRSRRVVSTTLDACLWVATKAEANARLLAKQRAKKEKKRGRDR